MANDRALFTAELILTTKSDPETPPPGSFCLFPQANGALYLKNSNGDVYPVGNVPGSLSDVRTSGSSLANQVGVWVDNTTMEGFGSLTFDPEANRLAIGGTLAIGNSDVVQLGPSRIELRNIGFVDTNTASAIKQSLNLGFTDIGGTLPTSRISGYNSSGTTNYLRQDGTWQPITVETFPPGMVTPFAGESAPTGWLLCQGQALPTATYPNLFTTIGYTYGGSGSTFNLPDLRQRVPVGVGTGFARGQTGGSQTHTLTVNEMPSHSHTTTPHNHSVTDPSHSHGTYAEGNFGFKNEGTSGSGVEPVYVFESPVGTQYDQIVSSETTGISIDNATVTVGNTGGGQPHNNMQPYIVLNYIIKT
jgi:microcystin-dependent protein